MGRVSKKPGLMDGTQLCVGLSALTVLANLATEFLSGDGNGGLIMFLCFLPMCFYFTVRAFSERCSLLQKKIEALEAVVGAPDAVNGGADAS